MTTLKTRASLGPTREKERILIMDAARGLAVWGILLANIIIFAFPQGFTNPMHQGAGAGEKLLGLLLAFFVEGKFYTLFSLLFGMGLALQYRRARDSGKAFYPMYLRRLLALFLLGICHALLFFVADILAFYAVIALLAFPFTQLQPKTLLALAVIIFIAGSLIWTGQSLYRKGDILPGEPHWKQSAQAGVLKGPFPFPYLLAKENPQKQAELFSFMSYEERIFQKGSLGEMIQHRTINYFLVGWPLRLLFVSWRVLAFFLLGMALTGSFLNLDENRKKELARNTALYGFFSGMVLQFLGGSVQGIISTNPYLLPVFIIGIIGGSLALALSYGGILYLKCLNKPDSFLCRSLAAMGRTALTNYLGQSLICGFLFYSWGLGLFNSLSHTLAILITIPIILMQMIISLLWLRFFQFGPIEWIWRSLAYWKRQPMRRPQ